MPRPGELISIVRVTFAADAGLIVLQRISTLGEKPTYCVHGQTQCVACAGWVWLGNASYELVAQGRARPICKPCANTVLPSSARAIRNVGDHQRADGPHD